MTKIFSKISYVSLLVILFGLIAISLIIRNAMMLKNNEEFEATCYSFDKVEEGYKVSYYYIHNGHTYYITDIEKDKPKLSSKKKIYCNKFDTSKCVLDINRYVKGLYISIIAFIPALIFLIIEFTHSRHCIKNDTMQT